MAPVYHEDKVLFCENEQTVSHYVIFTPSHFARSCLIYPQEAGTLQAIQSYTTGRSGVESYLFFIVLSGSGSFLYDGTTCTIHTGDCVFIDCRKDYQQITSDDLWTLQWVHMNGLPVQSIYQKYREHGGKPVFSTNHTAQYHELLNQIYHAPNTGTYVESMELSELMTTLLTLLLKETQSVPGRRGHTASKLDLEQVREYLDEHYMEEISLERLSEHFFIDKFYLTKIFKKRYDITINNYLNQQRITRAKKLLRFSEFSVQEIATQVGINELNYFSRVFKKIEGVTPSIYREQWMSH